jgi:hypothetical protein
LPSTSSTSAHNDRAEDADRAPSKVAGDHSGASAFLA